MAMFGRLLAGLVFAFTLLISPRVLWAEEVINDYHVDIEVTEDGVLEITERLLISVENDQILHGIDREIYLAFRAADGHHARSILTVLSVERDSEAENYEIRENHRGAVIRIGSSDVELVPDDYLYEIHYQIKRVVNFLGEHDRLIWNVNGTEGHLPINALSVRVTLPEGSAPLAVDVYTGRFGEDGKDAIVRQSGNVVTFTATRPYAAGENMSIDLQLPKGVLQPPDEATLNEWKYYDYESTISATVIFICSASLAFFLWVLFGRDPRPGVIVPRWDAPADMSPGKVNYSVSRNFETGFWVAFSATVIDLAVKGKLVLEDLADGISVRKVSDEEDFSLSTEQAAIMRMLPPVGESFRFNSLNAARTQKIGGAFSEAVVTEIGHKYYKPRNWIWINFGLLVFLVLVMHEIGFTVGVKYVDDLLPIHWIVAFVACFFAIKAVYKWRNVRFSLSKASAKERFYIVKNLSISAVILLVVAMFVYADEPVVRDGFLLTFSLVMISTLLWAFIGRQSREGREVMDEIDGLRLYFQLAEKDRMALADAPSMSPSHYETLLPYAVALGVEKVWSKHFENALAEARAANDYDPSWYTETSVGTLAKVDGISAFTSGIATRIESSLPSETDSYGSGYSSSSGGGRGGGGVSGW